MGKKRLPSKDITTWPDTELQYHITKLTSLRYYLEEQLGLWQDDLANDRDVIAAKDHVHHMQYILSAIAKTLDLDKAERSRRKTLKKSTGVTATVP